EKFENRRYARRKVYRKIFKSQMPLINRKFEERIEYDLIDQYVHGDDIRFIDWNVTARGISSVPYVRKRIQKLIMKLTFVIDMRPLETEEGRGRWINDFVRALFILDREHKVERLIFILNGRHFYPVPVNEYFDLSTKYHVKKLLRWIYRGYQLKEIDLWSSAIKGLRFLSEEENQRFCQQLKLGLSPQGSDFRADFATLSIKSENIVAVGLTENMKKALRSLHLHNQVFL
ncbi:MAG: DUF58 domain-containing protein, partial [Candidatus Omnitrophica bacterium]|nr:DUF58 domain-containing protein [Candidatus Omnitrophota bacterium]